MVQENSLFDRKETPDGWDYKDPVERALVFDSVLFLSFDLPSFDTWLERLDDCPAKTDLVKLRMGAVALIKTDAWDHIKDRLTVLKLWRHIIEREDYVLPLARIGKKQKATQQAKAKKPRLKTDGNGGVFCVKTTALQLKSYNQNETAKELWPKLYAALESAGLSPKEFNDRYRYTDGKDREQTISFGTFRNYLSKYKRK